MVREAKIVVTRQVLVAKRKKKRKLMRYKQSFINLKREIDLSILSYVFQCALTCVVLIMNYTRFLNDVNAIRVVIDHCP